MKSPRDDLHILQNIVQLKVSRYDLNKMASKRYDWSLHTLHSSFICCFFPLIYLKLTSSMQTLYPSKLHKQCSIAPQVQKQWSPWPQTGPFRQLMQMICPSICFSLNNISLFENASFTREMYQIVNNYLTAIRLDII